MDWGAFVADSGDAEFAAFREHYPGCAECSRELARWSRLEGALRGLERGDGHPDVSELLVLERRPGDLDSARRDALTGHVESCAACRSELAALRGFDVAKLRAVEAPPAARVTPMRRWRLRAALAAAAGLLLALLWLRTQNGDRPPELARTQAAPAPADEPGPAAQPGREHVPAATTPPADTGLAAAPPREPSGPTGAPLAEPRAPVEEPLAAEPAPPGPGGAEAAPPLVVALSFPDEVLRYAAPGPDDAALVALHRSGVLRARAGANARIQVLAPQHVGLTARASPTLYWSLSAATDLRVELVVVDESGEMPVLDRALDGAEAGVHALRLSELGVELRPGVTYRWYASLVPDPEDRSSEVVSGGAVRRIEPGPELARALAEVEPGRRAHLEAESGLFYDALDTLSRWRASRPDAAEPRRDRDALLEAVGLPGEAAGGDGSADP